MFAEDGPALQPLPVEAGSFDIAISNLAVGDLPNPAAALLKTPLHPLHLELGAKMVPFAGYEMPVQYDGIIAEHLWTRENAGLFDVSHMGEVEVHALRGVDLHAERGEMIFECRGVVVTHRRAHGDDDTRAHASYDELVADPDVDVVYVLGRDAAPGRRASTRRRRRGSPNRRAGPASRRAPRCSSPPAPFSRSMVRRRIWI